MQDFKVGDVVKFDIHKDASEQILIITHIKDDLFVICQYLNKIDGKFYSIELLQSSISKAH